MIKCEKCDMECGTEIVYSEDSHGFTDGGPSEQFSDEISDCCAAATYEEPQPCCRHDLSLHLGGFCPVIGCHCGDVGRDAASGR